MANDLQPHNGHGAQIAPYAPPAQALTDDKLALLQRTVCKGSSRDEFDLFVARCRQTGLDPFSGQIMAIMRRTGAGQAMTIQVGIHGLRLIAERSGDYAPGDDTQYEYAPDGGLLSARAFVKKWARGQWHVVSERAFWEEYVQVKDGRPVSLWATKPHVMLGKCAEALALRRAFPQETSGLYIREEMMQAEPVNVTPAGEAAARPADHARPAERPPARDHAPQGQGPQTTANPACEDCGRALTAAQKQLSVRNYGAALCPNCQKKPRTDSAPAEGGRGVNGEPAGGDPFVDDDPEALFDVTQGGSPGHGD